MGEEDRELVAAHPERPIAPPKGRGGDPAHRRQQLVARGVAPLVVDLLEVVDVHDQERQRAVRPLGEVELAGELVLERAVVAQPRQGVDQRVVAGLAVELEQLGALALELLDRVEHAPGKVGHRRWQADRAEEQDEDRAIVAGSGAGPESLDRGEPHDHRELDEHRGDQAAADQLQAHIPWDCPVFGWLGRHEVLCVPPIGHV